MTLAVMLGGAGGCANGGDTSAGGGDDGSSGDVTTLEGGEGGGEAGACGAGKTMCGATCTNTGNDPKNCGKCGNACPTGQVCSMGACGYSCAPPESLCGVNEGGAPPIDASGAAETGAAEGGARDAAGAGDASATDSGSGPTIDAGNPMTPYCANTGNDPNNCGACGNACGPGETCSSGSCTCGAGQRYCFASSSCIPTNSCCNDNDCPIAGELCATPGGACACPGGEKPCMAQGDGGAFSACISSNDCCTSADCTSIMGGASCPGPGQSCQCGNGDKLCIVEKTCIPPGDCCDVTDCPPPSGVKTTSCGTMGTTGGTCSITTCDSGCYNLDGQYADGCECCDDVYGKTCANATALGSLTLGAAPVVKNGGVLPVGNEGDWFQVTFNTENNTAFHGIITLTQGAGEYVFDVIQGSCSGGPLNCGEGGGCTGKTTWEESYSGPSPAADPTDPTFTAVPAVGAVWIHVYRANMSTVTCNPFTLSVQE